jgi:hypothetical protein
VRSAQKKTSPFARKATGTSEAYSIDLVDILQQSYAGNAEPALRNRAVAQLVAGGDAAIGTSKEIKELKGEPVTAIQIDKNGRTFIDVSGEQEPFGTATRYLFVRSSLAPELLRVFGSRATAPDMTLHGAASLVNKAVITSLVEPSAHIANQIGKLVKDLTVWRVGDIMANVKGQILDDPAVMKELTAVGKEGALRAEHPAEEGLTDLGFLPTKMFRRATSATISITDRTVRLMTDQLVTRQIESGKLPKEGEAEYRRNMINELGQYDARAQSWLMGSLRRTGMSQFVTAGVNFNVLGLKSFVSPRALIGAGTILGLTAMTNKAMWGRMDGDDQCPVGGIYLGKWDGKVHYISLFSFHPLSRGLRVTGANPIIEHIRGVDGKTSGQMVDASASDIIDGWIGPFIGPPVRVGLTAATGHSDIRGRYWEAERAKKGESQTWKNIEAAALLINPTLKKIVTGQGSYVGKWGIQERKDKASSGGTGVKSYK